MEEVSTSKCAGMIVANICADISAVMRGTADRDSGICIVHSCRSAAEMGYEAANQAAACDLTFSV